MRRCEALAAAALVVGMASELGAAPADVPAAMVYQGLLLDDLGAPQAGPVDLVVRIYDLAAGGTLLYKQEYSGTALSDGTFNLTIGPIGAATDVPIDPLSTSFQDVFSGDLSSGPDRFFELTVAGDPALGRSQILSTPLAMRVDSAGNAEHADTADSATTAQTAVAIDGVDASFISQMFQHIDYDGTGPPNDDPSEGVGDADGDGLANFIDPDNDDDGLNDSADAAAGGDINLVTPTLASVTPTGAFTFETPVVTIAGTNFEPGITVNVGPETPIPTNLTATSMDVLIGPQTEGSVDVSVVRLNGESDVITNGFTWTVKRPTISALTPVEAPFLESSDVTIHGTNFESDMTVAFGSESPTPTNVTGTSARVTVGPQPLGSVDVTVTLSSGESDTLTNGFTWVPKMPTIAFLSPSQAASILPADVTINGTNFEPDMTVVFGSENPTPTNVTDTTADVTVGPQPLGSVDVTVTLSNGESDTRTNGFTWTTLVGIPHGVVTPRTETFGVRSNLETMIGFNADDYRLSNNGNPIPNLIVGINGVGEADWAFGPGGAVRGVRCVASGTDCTVFGGWDLNGDDITEAQFPVEVISATTQASLLSADVAVNASDLRVLSYVRGRLDASLEADVVVAVDYNADDDWDDPNERIELETGLADATVVAAVRSTGAPVVMWDRDPSGSGDVTLAADLNGDGDFADTVGANAEVRSIAGPGVDCYDVTVDGSDRVAMVYQVTGNPGVTFQHDRNGDDDFDDVGETQNFSDGPASLCAITPGGATGVAFVYENGAVSMRYDRNDDGDFDDASESLLDMTGGVNELNLATNPDGDPELVTDAHFFNVF